MNPTNTFFFLLTWSLDTHAVHQISQHSYCRGNGGNKQETECQLCRFQQCNWLFIIQGRTSSYKSAMFSVTDSLLFPLFIFPSVIRLLPYNVSAQSLLHTVSRKHVVHSKTVAEFYFDLPVVYFTYFFV